jgi:hypothetical protein
MPVVKKYYFITVIALSCTLQGWCQSFESGISLSASSNNSQTLAVPDDTIPKQATFIIGDIYITGNRKTKPYIIERELNFKRGDSVYLPDLVAGFQRSKELLINTKLFNDAVIFLKSFRGYVVDIQIEVKERWYIFPIPYFKPVDRNLSAWAEKDYSLERVNYGAKFTYYNFTGRNDKLRMWLITGYTRQVQFSYDQPYADKSLKWGYNIGISYSALKEINAGTVNNQQFFLKADSIPYAGKFLTELFNISLGYSYRPAIKTRYSARLAFNNIKIDTAVTVANPKYFNSGSRNLFYPEIATSMDYVNVDYIPYVLRGLMYNVSLTRKGVTKDMNLWQLDGKLTKGMGLGWKSYYGFQVVGTLKLPFHQPFYNQQLFGYGDLYLRGLEKYVIDGVAGLMIKNTVRRELLKFNFSLSRFKSHDHIPFRIYGKVYSDVGYSHNKSTFVNSLTNKLLYTGGAGLDIVTMYDLVFRFEYSFNQLGQKGFFFHVRNDF